MKLLRKPNLSLPEIVISSVIFVAGLIGMAPLLGIRVLGVNLSGEMRQANEMAQTELENLMQLSGWKELPYLSVADSVSGIYSLTRRIDDAGSDSTIPDGKIRFQVSLAWSDQHWINRTVSYTVFRSDARSMAVSVKENTGGNSLRSSQGRKSAVTGATKNTITKFIS